MALKITSIVRKAYRGKSFGSFTKFLGHANKTEQPEDMPVVDPEITDTVHTQQSTAVMPLPEKSRFAKSKTVCNVVLPLKPTRMAKPFPDPVKVMPSDIVSDQDRRDQMFEESKQYLYQSSDKYEK